jgi:carboxyl-terminal processing protease
MLKNFKSLSVTLIVAVILGATLLTGCNPPFTASNPQPETGTAETDPELGKEVLDQAWQIIFDEYVDKDKLDAGELSRAAIRGMLEALDDPYSTYMDASDYQSTRESIEGQFEGIGAYVDMRDGQITIVAPIPGSPAEAAGIRAGDIVMEIDGSPISGISLEEVISRIRGPKGTAVKLLILHAGGTEPVEIEIIRDEIKMASTIFEMKGDIAYIAISHFTERTSEEMGPIMESLDSEGASGIVLDLRHNPGGLLDSVVDVASRFLKEGVVLKVVDSQGKKTVYSVNPDVTTKTELPMVVLTDNFTASASEVLAGALQDHDRATIAGTVTYGKGSVNLLNRLKDNSGLYITYARWLTPDDHMIEGEGIHPDHELNLEGEDAIRWALDYLENSNK